MTVSVKFHVRRAHQHSRQNAPPGTSWCPRHSGGEGAWVPREEFGRYGTHGVQKYCRACRSTYLKRWRLEGKPAKQRAAYDREKASGLDAIAAKYANK